MEDRLTDLMAKLDRMRDAQVALQERLSSAKRTGGGGGEAGEEPGAAAGDQPPADLHHQHDSTTNTSTTATAESLGASSLEEGSGSTSDSQTTGGTGDPFDMYTVQRETLLVAAKNGNLDALKTTVSEWSDDSYLMNESLYLAASNGHLQCAIILVENNADCKYWHSPEDQTVLSASAANGHVQLVEFLLEKRVDMNQRVHGDKHTALHSAAIHGQLDCAKCLIDSGCDVNAKDTFGITPLMAACKEGHAEVVQLLLASNADPTLKSRVRKETAFAIAFGDDQAACVRELLIACPEESKKPLKGGLLPLHHAIRHGKDEIVCALIDGGIDLNLADGPWTPIHLAVEMNNVPIVATLAACGAELNAPLPVPKKVTLLMLAVCKENPEMVRAIGSQASCNMNQFDELGRTSLYLAAKFGYVKCVEVLLEICADVDAHAAHMIQERQSGNRSVPLPAPTALHAAILNDQPEVASLLIAAGCKMDMGAFFEEDGVQNVFTPLHVACLKKFQWAVDMLLEGGAPVPPDFTDWCKTNGLDAAITAHIEAAVSSQKKNPSMLKKVCRGYIRNSLGNLEMYSKIKGLDVPFGIREYLLFNDLNAFI